ncbi:MAG: hypothetical protein Q4F84_00570, partial [Fibrobacter sp.]|nr:hypothetical protein [Fibrobacter sp.]
NTFEFIELTKDEFEIISSTMDDFFFVSRGGEGEFTGQEIEKEIEKYTEDSKHSAWFRSVNHGILVIKVIYEGYTYYLGFIR